MRQGWSLDARDVLVLVDSTMSLAGSDHFYNPYTGKGQVLFTGKLQLFKDLDLEINVDTKLYKCQVL